MEKRKVSPPFILSFLLRLLLKDEEYLEFSGDINEIFREMISRGPKWKAKAWYACRVLESSPGLIVDNIRWRSTMIKNYLKIALRNFRRHLGYSFINIVGFAIGMACCLLILVYVRHELSYDRYHKDAERIFRISLDIRTPTANRVFALVSPTVAPALKADFPQVEFAARLLPAENRLVKRGEAFFYENLFTYADQELFDVLTIRFLRGNPRTALTRPQTLVISERMALKYFGGENPLGKTLNINTRDYEITGVVEDPPGTTHLKFDLIASLETLATWNEMSNWHSTMFYTYLKLRPNVNVEEFSRRAGRMADKYVGETLAGWKETYQYFLQPIAGIHLYSHIRYEVEPPGNPSAVYILSFVSLFILLIACLNFMNLSTARSVERAKEVGLRKVVGAQRSQLIAQFLGESLLVAFMALIMAMVMVRIALPLLNTFAGTSLKFAGLLSQGVLISLIFGGILIGLAAGVYPAFVLSAFRPAATIKGSHASGSRRFAMRTVLVVIQFVISIVLIIGTLLMSQQFTFMKNQPLGFDKEQKLILPLRGGISIANNFETVKEMFAKHPGILAATVSSSIPGRGVSNFAIKLVGEDDDRNQSMFHLYFDEDFLPAYGIKIIAGRGFQKSMKTDIAGAFLINEAALKAFGWAKPEEALGKRLLTGYGGRVNPIIGVTRNFHYRGLQTEVEPLVMEYMPDSFRYVTLSVDITKLKDIMPFVESRWKALFPANPFESFFLDTDFDLQYRSDEQLGRIFGIFTLLGLLIACLGLLGLASFTTESRTKEIGVRKVLGASVPGIVLMLSKEFSKWVLLANGLAWPVAYYLLAKWLKNFAYHIKIDIVTFLLSGAFVLAIALITVSFQTYRAARANPVDSLRYE